MQDWIFKNKQRVLNIACCLHETKDKKVVICELFELLVEYGLGFGVPANFSVQVLPVPVPAHLNNVNQLNETFRAITLGRINF
jgi:hypothetical protein